MTENLVLQISKIISEFSQRIDKKISRWESVRASTAFRRMEVEISTMARELADQITEKLLRAIVLNGSFQQQTVEALRRTGRYRNGGIRMTKVTLLGGRTITLKTLYLRPDLRGRRGRTRGVGKRGKAGAGCYPVLASLGIDFGVTAAAVSEICRQVADSDSVRSGREALSRRGLDLGHKQTLRIVNQASQRAVQQREQMLDAARKNAPERGILRNKRVLVAIDGGRIRERVVKPGRRRKKTGHFGYETPWREPKLFVIYTIDKEGRPEPLLLPICDGTMGDCDAVMRMLLGYLKMLGAHEAKELVIAGDGAKWIWERTGELVRQLGISCKRVTEVIDWFHAVEVLHEIASVKKWSSKQGETWLNRVIRLLNKGEIERLLPEIDKLTVGRRAREIGKHRDYFERNKKRMRYRDFKSARIPRGSGAIESAIRRVVNMRMKGCGTFWLVQNAEGMLMLRSYLKAGRLDDLMDWSVSQASKWWPKNNDATLIKNAA